MQNSLLGLLLDRAETLCDVDKKHQENQHIGKVLHNNYHPEQTINITANIHHNNNVPETSNNTQPVYISCTLHMKYIRTRITAQNIFFLI